MKENYCFNAVQDGVSYKIAFPKVTFYKGLNCPAAHKDSTETLSTDCQSTASEGSYGYGAAVTVTENEETEREREKERRFLQTSGDDDNPPPRGNTDLYSKWYEYIAVPPTASPASSITVAPTPSPSSISPSEAPLTEAPIAADPSFSPSDAPLSYTMEPTTPGPTAPTLEPTIFPSTTLSPSEVPVASFPTLLPIVSSEPPSPYPSPSTPITPSTSVKVNFAQVSSIYIFLRF
jgi:hypothetical protein